MPDTFALSEFRGRTVVDSSGEKIGKIDDLYYDVLGGQPEWALVNTGMFGTKKTFVPIRRASSDGENLQVPVSKAQIKDAPHVEGDEDLSEPEERTLFEHYGVPYTSAGSTTAGPAPGAGDGETLGQRPGTGHTGTITTSELKDGGRASGPVADEAMTRSEEELHVGTARQERGRARLRKYVVTEYVEATVPVRREEVRLERSPITDVNRDQAMSGPDISEAEQEVVLHEEEPVVEKRAVPKERVRLRTEVVSEDRAVAEEIRKEQIEAEGLEDR